MMPTNKTWNLLNFLPIRMAIMISARLDRIRRWSPPTGFRGRLDRRRQSALVEDVTASDKPPLKMKWLVVTENGKQQLRMQWSVPANSGPGSQSA